MSRRFLDLADGDLCTQLAPWTIATMQWDGKPVPSGKALYRLEAALRFESDVAAGVIVVPKGFVSDMASIPRPAWALMDPDDPRIALGAWVHDLLYQNEGVITLEDGAARTLTRAQADHILAYEAMPDLGADAYICCTVYNALHYFGERWTNERPVAASQPEGDSL
jgi:hypothetical protein